MVINLLVYFKVIKNIFGTHEEDDYQILSEKLQNFLICIEMVLAALAHHYSYPYREHQINIPNYRAQSNVRDILGSMFDVNDIYQDLREHWGAVKNSLTRPFRGADPFLESNALLSSASGSGHKYSSARQTEQGTRNFERSSQTFSSNAAVPGSSRYGTVDYVSTMPIARPQRGTVGDQKEGVALGAPPQFGNLFGNSGRDSPPSNTTTSSSTAQACRKSDSNNSNSWPMLSKSISSDVVNIEVKGPEENLIQLPESPPM